MPKLQSELKSVKTYTDDSEKAEFLLERQQRRQDLLGPYPQTEIGLRGDGRPFVAKRSVPATVSSTLAVPSVEELKKMAEASGLPWQDGYADRVLGFWASDERVDRAGDIVRQTWDFTGYKENPLFLLGHDWDDMPIGSAIRWMVLNRKDEGYEGPALHKFVVFAPEVERADTAFRLAKARFVRTVSEGFFPGKVIDVEDDEERKELGLGRFGLIFEENEDIELSLVSVPANPGAKMSHLKSAHKAGLLQASDINVIRELIRGEIISGPKDAIKWRQIDEAIRSMWKSLYPDTKVKAHPCLDEPVSCEADSKDKEQQERFEKLEDEVRRLSARVEDLTETIDIASEAFSLGTNKTESEGDLTSFYEEIDSVVSSVKSLTKR